MKLKYEFEKVELDGQTMAVPVGDNADEFHAILRLNDTASFILDCLKEETTPEQVLSAVLNEYDGDTETIRHYVEDYLAYLVRIGVAG